jgi:acetyl-CoA carboxylase biotin carboxyl carrier protein
VLDFGGAYDGYCDGLVHPSAREERRTAMMNLDELKQILEMVREHELSELELERDGFKIRVRKGSPAVTRAEAGGSYQVDSPAPVISVTPVPVASPAPAPLPTPPSAEPRGEETEVELAVVKSPIVGTFYRAPEPGAKPFVEVGQTVRKGQVLCIIEAMKLMNEIESEYSGELVSIYVENGQPVQYGERLFAIRAR